MSKRCGQSMRGCCQTVFRVRVWSCVRGCVQSEGVWSCVKGCSLSMSGCCQSVCSERGMWS